MKKILILFVVSVITLATQAFAMDVKTIDKEALKEQLGSTDLVVLDVRRGSDWDDSEFKIKGAVRADPADVQSWVKNFSPDKTYVLYCS